MTSTTPSTLSGRTVMIAGASSGLGAHFARLFVAHGARVVLGARRVERIEALATELNAGGQVALPVRLDVTDEASVIAAYDAAEAAFGTVDTVIANAGTEGAGRSTDVPTTSIRSVIDTNLVGVYLTAREGAKRMIAAGTRETERGRIILIGSITADMHGIGDAAYAASKAAVAHLGRNFAKEWARQGVNVNVVQPGYIRTEITGDWIDGPLGAKLLATFPRRRLVEIEGLDDMMLYFASDRSRQVTGAVISIDDGQSL